MNKWGAHDVPEFKAMLAVWFIVLSNIFTIGLVFQVLGIVQVLGLPKDVLLLVLVLVAGILYFLFVSQKKYKVIEQKFKNENSKQKKINSIIMWFYIIGSFAINFFIIRIFLK